MIQKFLAAVTLLLISTQSWALTTIYTVYGDSSNAGPAVYTYTSGPAAQSTALSSSQGGINQTAIAPQTTALAGNLAGSIAAAAVANHSGNPAAIMGTQNALVNIEANAIATGITGTVTGVADALNH